MKPVIVPNSSALTTQLGFGCAYIVSGLEKKSSIRLVDAAFDAGLRHFDVAPPYGLGTAEDLLGMALARRRSEVTIASKAGLARPHVTPQIMLIRSLAAPLRRHLPSLTRALGAKMACGGRGQFSPASVEQSLNETLRRLRTDYLDLFLLHEAQAGDISDELLTVLDKRRRDGVVRAIGVASIYEAAVEISVAHANLFDVFQYSWSVLDVGRVRPMDAKYVITHRAILRAFNPLRSWLRSDRSAMSRLSAAVGMDLGSEETLADVLLGAALDTNEGGIVLTSSRKVHRVHHLGEVMRDPVLLSAGRKLTAALFAESARPRLD